MECDYKDCKNEGISMCILFDVVGTDFHCCFCKEHLKKMINDKNAIYED